MAEKPGFSAQEIINQYTKSETQERQAEKIEVSVENTPETNAAAQSMVDKILDRGEAIPESDYRKILTLADLRGLIDSLTPEKLVALDSGLDVSEKEIPKVLELLRGMVSGRDNTTGLQNKFALNDSLRQTVIDIVTTKDETEKIEKMRHSGLIYFDVRGLKMINDARKNHSDGDAFIARVAAETKVVAEQIFSKILGENSVSGIFRDGGDEFAISFDNTRHDLEAVVTKESIAEIFPETITVERNPPDDSQELELRRYALEISGLDTADTSDLKLIEVLSKILELMMFEQKFVSDSFPREAIEAHLKKGDPNYHNPALADFDMPIMIAEGAQSNYSVLKETKSSYHKKTLPDETITSLGAAETVNLLMSAMRLSADQRSYDAKNYQNNIWITSNDPFQQLLIDLVSRNEITVEYAESLRRAKKVLVQVYTEKEEYREENLRLYEEAQKREQECQEGKQELAKAYGQLEKAMAELAEQKRKIEEIARKIYLLTV